MINNYTTAWFWLIAVGGVLLIFYFHQKTCSKIRELKKIHELQSDFISTIAHQLRTSLTSIKWSIENLLEKNNLQAGQEEILNDVYIANQHMVVLVNNLLNASKLERGKIIAKRQFGDIEKLMRSIMKLRESEAKAKNVSINFIIETRIKDIQFDPDLFSEAFENILDNAIAYSAADSTVDVTLSEDDKKYIIAVHNDGSTISEKDRDKIFTKFYRGAAAAAAGIVHSGSGLGLFIARSAIRANGGDVWFESPTHGADGVTFYISVPIA